MVRRDWRLPTWYELRAQLREPTLCASESHGVADRPTCRTRYRASLQRVWTGWDKDGGDARGRAGSAARQPQLQPRHPIEVGVPPKTHRQEKTTYGAFWRHTSFPCSQASRSLVTRALVPLDHV